MAWPPEVIEAESPLYEMLRVMVKRPGMYFGEQPLEAFRGFLDGYRTGLEMAGRTDPVSEAMKSRDFDAFVAARLDLPNKYPGENAFKMIAYVSPSRGRSAFLDLVSMLDEYLDAEGAPRSDPGLSTVIRDERTGQQGET